MPRQVSVKFKFLTNAVFVKGNPQLDKIQSQSLNLYKFDFINHGVRLNFVKHISIAMLD